MTTPKASLRRRAASLLLGVGLAATPFLWADAIPAAAVGGAGPQPTEAEQAEPAPQAPTASVRLLQQGPVLREDGTYYVDVEVLLPPSSDDQLEVAATVHQRVKTRESFIRTNLNAELGSVIGVSRTVDVNAIAGPETGTQREIPMRLSLPIGTTSLSCLLCINLRADGVYPVLVELRSTRTESVVDEFTTYLIRAFTPTADPLKFALIVPLRTAPSRDSEGQPQTPSTRNLIGFIEALVGRASTPVTIAPTPESLDTLARLERENPSSSPLLDQIRQVLVGRELLSVPYRSLSSAIANEPQFARLLEGNRQLGDDTTTERLGTSPTGGIGIYTDRMVGLNALGELNQTRVVVQDSALEPFSSPGGTAPPALPVLIDAAVIDNSDGVPVLGVVLDRDLEDHFVRKLSSRGPGADDVLRAQHLIADLAMLQASQSPGPHGEAVLVPESTSQATLAEVLAGMDSKDLIEPVKLSTLFDLPLASVNGSGLVRTPVVSPATLPTTLKTQVTRILSRLDGYRSAFQTPASDANDLEKRLLVALASISRAETVAPTNLVRSAINRIEDEANARIGTIRLSPNDIVTLTGRQQDVPIPIINDSGQPATVILEVSSDNVSIDGSVADPDRPGQLVIRRTISIDSRIHQEQVLVTTRGPGSFSMVLRLTTPSGLPLTNVRYTLRSTAVGGLGKILTIGALLVLGAWWIRSTIRTRRHGSLDRHPAAGPKPSAVAQRVPDETGRSTEPPGEAPMSGPIGEPMIEPTVNGSGVNGIRPERPPTVATEAGPAATASAETAS